MKRNILLAVVLSIICVFTGLAHAESVPTPIILFEDVVVNATGSVESSEQNLTRAKEPGGDFALAVNATSIAGTADLQIEVLLYNPASETWSGTFYSYNSSADVLLTYSGVIADSTFTRFTRDGAFYFFPVGVPLIGSFKVKVTGVGSNPADTILNAVLIRK